MKPITVALAQLDFTVGAIRRNTNTILDCLQNQQGADIVVFPELAITGYPPEDLLFRADFEARVDAALEQIAQAAVDNVAVVGHPQRVGNELFNSVSVLHRGKCLARYHKQRLPQYGVFDEQRYFIPGHEPQYFEWQGHRVGLLVCEDLWHPDPLKHLLALDVDWVIAINASPYEVDKHEQRMHVLKQRSHESGIPIVYVNNCGGQDELVFDGHSLVLDADGELVAELPHCEPCCARIRFEASGIKPLDNIAIPRVIEEEQIEEKRLEQVYRALVLSVRDYVNKNGFKGVTLGLSGGIDSALTLAVAVDALGAEHVHAVMMPFRYTSQMSKDDAAEQAHKLGVRYDVIAIEPIYESFMQQLTPVFASDSKDTTEENLQARSRGVVLMALSNKQNSLVLTTGNKSELAVGYCTLYGDMCGGFAPLKDVPKMMVFALANFRNKDGEVIPQRVIDRPPSAELALDQKDQDSLPDYADLDEIISLYVEQDWSPSEIVDAGYSREDVLRVIRLIDINEYKRRQAAVGPKITSRNFGKDRRYPITNHYRYELERELTERDNQSGNQSDNKGSE